MKNILMVVLLLTSNILFCQSEKGARPLNTTIEEKATGVSRAVIVGVSDYRHEHIPDLQYAHKDAAAFKTYLQSTAGGALPEEDIQLLVNEEATTGQIVAAMSWLVEESLPGDKAIIYFSGHGDVERISKFQRGYLLTYDSPPNNYMAGAFPVLGLQDIISTLSEMNVAVVMISDACRAGKLAGSHVGGVQATSAVLAQQFANEIKILSCQPEELSLEGVQWGGGRGCFSYHLLDGLYGLADKNADRKINLLELERYLEDMVMTEAAPHSQIPMAIGHKGAILANVNQEHLEAIIAGKEKQALILAGIESKGIEDLILENADTNIQLLYEAFLSAIDSGHLMEPLGASANDYYEQLIKERSIAQLHGFMRRNFAAALQDESQEALYDLFYSTEKYYTEYFYTEKKSLTKFADYLKRATELLGNDHYMYNSLKARQLYFTCHNLWENNTDIAPAELSKMVIDTCLKALKYDKEAAYLYKGLAQTYSFGDTTKAIYYFEQALEYAPNWAILHADYALFNRDILKYDKAIMHCKKAIAIDSNLMQSYQWLSYIYTMQGDWGKRSDILNETADRLEYIISSTPKEEVFPYYFYQLGEIYWMIGKKPERSEAVLKTALELVGDKLPRIRTVLGSLYKNNNRYEEAEVQLEIAIEQTGIGQGGEPMIYLAQMYHENLKQHEKAEAYTLRAIETINESEKGRLGYMYEYLGRIYLNGLKDFKKAAAAFEKGIAVYPSWISLHLRMIELSKAIEDASKTLSAYRNTISLFPDNRLVQLDFADYLLEADSLEAATRLIAQINPDSMVSHSEVYKFALLYYKIGEPTLAESILQAGIVQFPKSMWTYYNNACVYAIMNEPDKAVEQLEMAYEKGRLNFIQILEDDDFDTIRESTVFKGLLKKYFPDEYKE